MHREGAPPRTSLSHTSLAVLCMSRCNLTLSSTPATSLSYSSLVVLCMSRCNLTLSSPKDVHKFLDSVAKQLLLCYREHKEETLYQVSRRRRGAIPLRPPLPSVGCSMRMERGRQQNNKEGTRQVLLRAERQAAMKLSNIGQSVMGADVDAAEPAVWREFCHSADALSPSLLIHPTKYRGGVSRRRQPSTRLLPFRRRPLSIPIDTPTKR